MLRAYRGLTAAKHFKQFQIQNIRCYGTQTGAFDQPSSSNNVQQKKPKLKIDYEKMFKVNPDAFRTDHQWHETIIECDNLPFIMNRILPLADIHPNLTLNGPEYFRLLHKCRTRRDYMSGQVLFQHAEAHGMRHINLDIQYLNLLVDCLLFKEAQAFFQERKLSTNTICCTAMIRLYGSQRDTVNEAFRVLDQMIADKVQLDSHTYSILLGLCKYHRLVDKGEQIIEMMPPYDINRPAIAVEAILMYSKCKLISKAEDFFNRLISTFQTVDIRIWNSMFSAYRSANLPKDALALLDRMVKQYNITPDTWTYNIVLDAFVRARSFDTAMQIYSQIPDEIKQRVEIKNVMLKLYAYCGKQQEMEQVLATIPMEQRTTYSVQTVAKAYLRNNEVEKLSELLQENAK